MKRKTKYETEDVDTDELDQEIDEVIAMLQEMKLRIAEARRLNNKQSGAKKGKTAPLYSMPSWRTVVSKVYATASGWLKSVAELKRK